MPGDVIEMRIVSGKGKETVSEADSRRLVNEAPAVAGMMSTVIDAGGSLDTAVRDIARNGPACSRRLFGEVVFAADTREARDIRTDLSGMLMRLPAAAVSYRRSMQMMIAASESGDGNERKRMLKDAADLALAGLKEAGEAYGASLNTPCMVVFGLGIMVPMILMSILPMLNLGGMFGRSPISPAALSAITLIVIPAAIATVILSIKESNPFMSAADEKADLRYVMPFIGAAAIAFLIHSRTGSLELSVTSAFAVVGAVMYAVMRPEAGREKVRAEQEACLKDSVFELGNRLSSGENFENAVVAAVGIKKECVPLADALRNEMLMCRGDCCAAVDTVIGGISPTVSGFVCDIHRCSRKDIRDAGRLAISLGRQLQDQETVRKGIGNKLKGMVDMMTGTAMLFAPLVLGMSVAMLRPLADLVGGGAGDTAAILVVYLIELCVLTAFLTAYLKGDPGFKGIMRRIAVALPVSLSVFHLCTSIAF